MKFYRAANSAASRILETFKTGDLPRALAPVFIHRRDNVPCRAWSWSNQLLAALAGHSDARGYRQWQDVGRHVRKGEKSFAILAPVTRKRTATDPDTGDEQEVTFVAGFTSAAVFGLSQTEGEPLPGPDPHVTRWLESLPLRDVAESWGLSVDTFNGAGARYAGFYKHGVAIALGVENLATWAHELVHAADDKCGTITKLPGQQPDNEIVAELGGATLLQILGHSVDADTGGAWEYISTYASRAKLEPIAACQKVLQRTCDAIALILDTAEKLQAENAGSLANA